MLSLESKWLAIIWHNVLQVIKELVVMGRYNIYNLNSLVTGKGSPAIKNATSHGKGCTSVSTIFTIFGNVKW